MTMISEKYDDETLSSHMQHPASMVEVVMLRI